MTDMTYTRADLERDALEHEAQLGRIAALLATKKLSFRQALAVRRDLAAAEQRWATAMGHLAGHVAEASE